MEEGLVPPIGGSRRWSRLSRSASGKGPHLCRTPGRAAYSTLAPRISRVHWAWKLSGVLNATKSADDA